MEDAARQDLSTGADLTLAAVAAWDDLASAAIKLCMANEKIDLARARLFLCLADHCRGIADEHRRAFNCRSPADRLVQPR